MVCASALVKRSFLSLGQRVPRHTGQVLPQVGPRAVSNCQARAGLGYMGTQGHLQLCGRSARVTTSQGAFPEKPEVKVFTQEPPSQLTMAADSSLDIRVKLSPRVGPMQQGDERVRHLL